MKNILLLFFALSIISPSVSQEQQPAQREIKKGKIGGYYDAKKDLFIYLGVPFAQPPVGELRWKAPQELEEWEGVKETTKFGPSPVQARIFDDMVFRSDGQSEDCLYLNVWTPAKRGTAKLPVLVYFYGGGFVAGDASEPRYDGAAMAQKGIIAITVNYRLNIFGFFAHPELSEEAEYNASGNYGLLDQHAALQWVQDNIAAFGGDPKKVTIAGESAGSVSVSAQMASPLSKDLIAGAIGESGAAIKPTLAPVSLAEAEKNGAEFAEKNGYTSIEEMKAASTAEIFESYRKSDAFRFSSVIDGYFLPETLPEIFRKRNQAQIPLLLGWNSAEIPGTAFMQDESYSEENYIEKVKETYPENFEEVLKLYPHSSADEIEKSATALASDSFISYSTWKWFDLHRKNSNEPVYRYLYSKLRPSLNNQDSENAPQQQPIGAPHAAEIEYFMGNLDLFDTYDWTEEDFTVSATIMQYLANFIKTGNPNGENLPEWPAAEAHDATPPVMIIDSKSKFKDAEKDDRYLFLDKAYGNIGE
ncbi:carboxylesterase family protein [Salegentibacter sp. F188]|uniref:Carboxylic ester hydrolase n=1 Tax=Autumnicola patrickiae TaxID=3075591 RepID=A0ABU3E227_9FLAO|nr:carboxylesterase family protein [Salegentibacter sp. F188]MDT0690018.1 carboxylesterase family protein [Salegentibacter sp. F188]